MTAKLMASLREAPVTVPGLVAIALFIVWATDQAAYPVTHWSPGTVILLALLCISVAVVRPRLAEMQRPLLLALAAFAAFTAFSYLSILWAAVPGDAWEGANRTLLYLIVFALFACWGQRGRTAALLLGGWTLAMVVLAGVTLLHVDAAATGRLPSLLPGGRLAYPTGYPNANAAQWLMAFWPALLLARSERLAWPLRGLLAGGAVLLAEVALLSQSRGSLYATPVLLVLVFALLPGRTRTFALLVPVGAGIAAAAPTVLRVGDHLRAGVVMPGAVHDATTVTLLAALVVTLAVGAGAAFESRATLSPDTTRRITAGVRALAVVTLLAAIVVGLAAAGNPVTRIRHSWDSFKRGYTPSTGSRLVSGLGSNRYDFYRVALDEFRAHPLAGIGVDNYQQQYLAHGRSTETPRYPHSVELRTLAQTGIIGLLLALAGLCAALLVAWRALRPPVDPLARAVAAAALSGFAYWLVHGSVDWFWEFAGLGAPAFALLGLACALAPPRPAREPASRASRAGAGGRWAASRAGRLAFAGACGLAAVAALLSIAAPWLSQREVESAARIWTQDPRAAYSRLDDAANLNPLSDEAYLVAGSIALRLGELDRADRDFRRALERDSEDPYATLERGAIASARGERPAALALLARAVKLNPRDGLTRAALAEARAGRRVSIPELNRAILLKSRRLA